MKDGKRNCIEAATWNSFIIVNDLLSNKTAVKQCRNSQKYAELSKVRSNYEHKAAALSPLSP